MMSIRTLSRVAPRAALRLSTPSIALRPAFHQISRQSIYRPQVLSSAFSTSRLYRDEYSQHLAAKLSSEIELEQEDAQTQAGSDANVEAFRAETDWNFDGDVAGSQDVFLTRQYEDETITVQFSIADFNNDLLGEDELDTALPDEEDMEIQSGGANSKGASTQGRTSGDNYKQAQDDGNVPADRDELADEEDQPQPFPVQVNVLVERPGGKGALKFLLTANEQQFVIEQLIHIPQSDFTDAKSILRETPDALYAGPPFQQLDEEVQGILERYLDARGITMELASVIPEYIDVKEQKEYLGWLGRVKEFVE